MKALALAKAIALATLFGLCTRMTPAQTQHQVEEMNLLTEKDWTDILDFGEWLLNAQFWFEHPDSQCSSLPTSTSVPLMKLHSARSCATSTSDTTS